MSHFKFRKPSPAMAVALTAMFVVLGGSAVAATRLLIHTKNIANGAVTNHKLANGAVGMAKLNLRLQRALASAGTPRGVVNGPQGSKGDSGAQGAKGDGGAKGDTGQQGPAGSLPAATTALGATYGPNTFQGATYGDNSQTAETCAPSGRGGEPANEVNGTIAFATPPSAPPLGTKALEMKSGSNGKSVVTYLPQDGCKSNELLSQLTDVSYSSLVVSRNASDSGGDTDFAFQVEVTGASLTGTGTYTTMVYEPYQNNQANATSWTMHNVAAGKVWSTHALTSGDCTQATPCPYATFLSENPNAQILDMKFRIGQNSGVGWSGFDGYVDNVWLNFARYDLGG